MTLPIIDITPFTSTSTRGTESQKQTALALHQACLKYGFFYLRLDGCIDRNEPEDLLALGRKFFMLPQEEKDTLAISNQDGARGYQRLKQNVTMGKADNHEGYDFYKPVSNPDKAKPLWGSNQWPDELLPEFRVQYEQWVDRMKDLGLIVMEAMAVGLGLTEDEWKELRSQVDDSFWVMRVIGYPQLPNDHDGYSCGAHKDYGCLTFLYADPTPNALQVFLNDPSVLQSEPSAAPEPTASLPNEQGGEKGIWIAADPIPGCCVCNIGEMWEIWTNGLYKSTLHRVVHRGSNYRYVPSFSNTQNPLLTETWHVRSVSLPFFFEPNLDARVKPLDAALRIQGLNAEKDKEKLKEETVYGEFLLGKVGNNFAKDGENTEKKGRY